MLPDGLLLLAALSTAPVLPENPNDPQAELRRFCADNPCRHDVDVSIRLRDGSTKHFKQPLAPPAIRRDGFTVLPGETVEAVAEFDGNTFQGWRAAHEGDDKTARVSIRLEQGEDGGMTAVVRNTGAFILKLDMFLVPLETDRKPAKTSSCPIAPGMSGYESWPFPFFQVGVSGARVLPDLKGVACE